MCVHRIIHRDGIKKDTVPFRALLFCAELLISHEQGGFDLLLELGNGLCAVNGFGLGLAVDLVGHDKIGGTLNANILCISKILLHLVFVFTTIVTFIEGVHIQTNAFRNGF